jgi:anthranilate synthase component 1
MVAESLVAFDHVKHRMVAMVNAHVNGGRPLREVYDEAVTKLAALKDRVRRPLPGRFQRTTNVPADATGGAQKFPLDPRDLTPVTMKVASSMDKKEYLGAVAKAKEYIAAGDIFQVVLSQRFSAGITCDPFDVYRALRAVNPSPYLFYLDCGGKFQIAGSSPEVLSKLQNGTVQVRPIAGTRPRGATPEEDVALEKDLLADEKERAEHVMLVDLGRNDVGRVSRYGTVTVSDFMTIERYSHVMHIVSNVTGELADGYDAIDTFGATFPAGTLTGAPKIRAMEIIDELETVRRGPYGGGVVYLGFSGAMDSCITIRTAIISGGRVYVQAGAGIVADSVPENEYMETVNKAKGMLRAIEMAEQGLD